MAQRWRNPLRHYCDQTGCEKSFIRKEHLTRHQLTHGEAPSYKCPICEKAFTRNDVLQKHIKNHTAPHDSTARNKRACYPCHRAKTRCAGGAPCLSCIKRSITTKCSVETPVKRIEPDVKSGIEGRRVGGLGGASQRGCRDISSPKQEKPSLYAKNLRDSCASYEETRERYKIERLQVPSRRANYGGSYGSSFVSHGGGFTSHLFQEALIQQQQPTSPDYIDVDSPAHCTLQAAFQSQLGCSSFVTLRSEGPISTFRCELTAENESAPHYHLRGCPEPISHPLQGRVETEDEYSFHEPPTSTPAHTPSKLIQFAFADAGSYGCSEEQPSSFSTRDEAHSPTTSRQPPSVMNQSTSFADMGSYVYRKPQQYLQTQTLIVNPSENQQPLKVAQPPQPAQCNLNSGYRNRVGARAIDIEAGKLYFTHFHPRWPIIHMSSYKEGIWKELDISVKMIGNFFKGTQASKMRALVKHDWLVVTLLPKLSMIAIRKPGTDDDKTWADFHASFINIIFAFYTGDPTLISQAVMMLSTLITAMRELKLFQPPELKAGHFPPHAMKLREQRKRLAIAVFQADAYLSIYRSKSQTVHRSELRFTLPHTYALWNARKTDNIDDWLAHEPNYRSRTPIQELFNMPSRSPWAPPMPVLLLEDIQLALCGLQQQIWDCLEKARELPWSTSSTASPEKPSAKEEEVLNIREHLQQQLDWWKKELDLFALIDEDEQLATIPRSRAATSNVSEEEKTAFKHAHTGTSPYHPKMDFETYVGLEDSEQKIKDVILSRPRTLMFDTLHLYHLLSIHLHTDVAALDRLAELRGERETQPLIPEKGPRQVALRVAATKWASPPRHAGALEALKHVSAIMSLNLKAQSLPKKESQGSAASQNATRAAIPRNLKAEIQNLAIRAPARSLNYIYTGPNTQNYATGPLPPGDESISRTFTPPLQAKPQVVPPQPLGGCQSHTSSHRAAKPPRPAQALAPESHGSSFRGRGPVADAPSSSSSANDRLFSSCLESPAPLSDRRECHRSEEASQPISATFLPAPSPLPAPAPNHPVVNMALYTSALVLHNWRVKCGADGARGTSTGVGKCGNRPVKQLKLDEESVVKHVGLCECEIEERVGMLGGWLGGGAWEEEGVEDEAEGKEGWNGTE